MSGRRWAVLRGAFLVAVIAGAWWSWRESGDELVTALQRMDLGNVLAATGLAAGGLAVTGAVWWWAIDCFGTALTAGRAVPAFFVAQLGKYIPGSVWAFAAQGALGARAGVPARIPATATVLFLGLHVASGLVVVGVLGWWTSLPAWVVGPSLAVGCMGLAPVVYRNLGGWLAGTSCPWDIGRSATGLACMLPAWGFYSAAVLAVTPGAGPGSVVEVGCAFALAHAAGAALPLAPAGLGAREGVLVLLLTPALGVGGATATAVLARLVHTVADFVLAGACWLLLAGRGPAEDSGADPVSH